MQISPVFVSICELISLFAIGPFLLGLFLKGSIYVNNFCAGGENSSFGISGATYTKVVKTCLFPLCFSGLIFIISEFLLNNKINKFVDDINLEVLQILTLIANSLHFLIVLPFFFYLVGREFNIEFLQTTLIVSCFCFALMVLASLIIMATMIGTLMLRPS